MGWTQSKDYNNEQFLISLQSATQSVSQLPGVFSIPVCASAVDSLKKFKKLIVKDGVFFGKQGNGQQGSPVEMVEYPG